MGGRLQCLHLPAAIDLIEECTSDSAHFRPQGPDMLLGYSADIIVTELRGETLHQIYFSLTILLTTHSE